MKEYAKEWLGIKPADFIIYAGFALLVPIYYSSNQLIDVSLSLVGLLLCLASCWIGMKPHPELGKANNLVKLIAYPACTVFFIYVVYLNFTAWQ